MNNFKELTIQEIQQVNGGGAGLGAAICAPTVVAAPACAIVGGLYGAVAGGFTAGLDSKK